MRAISASPCASEHERRLVGRRREVHALGQAVAEEAAEALGVARRRIGVRAHRARVEERRQHRADAVDGDRLARQAVADGRLDRGAGALEPVVRPGLREHVERGDAGGHRERVAGQRAGLVRRAERRQQLHQRPPAAEGRRGQPAAHDLAEGDEVRLEAVQLDGPARRDAEAAHDLVDHEQRAVLAAERRQQLQEAGLRRDDAHVARHALDHRAGEPGAVGGEGLLQRLGVVEGHDDRVGGDRGRHAGRGRDAERWRCPSRPARAARRRGRGSSRRTSARRRARWRCGPRAVRSWWPRCRTRRSAAGRRTGRRA